MCVPTYEIDCFARLKQLHRQHDFFDRFSLDQEHLVYLKLESSLRQVH